jgi:1-phosphatidylinositol-4-phosphate 5-kinase
VIISNPSTQMDCQIIYENVVVFDYGSHKFQKIRDMDGITPQMIKQSLDPEENLQQLFKAGESTGKSGSFFFFSRDRNFIIKTMFVDEMKVFIRELDQYIEHLEENPHSLIGRIYGIYQV